jgi:hypothetical protein
LEWLHFFSAFGYHILIMYLRIPRYLVALISVMVFVLAGQTSVQGYVWCLGENGHAALEHPVAGDCHGAERAPGVCGDEHSDNEDDAFHAFCEVASCGPCLDLPASVKANFRRAGDFDADDILIDLPLVGFSFPLAASSDQFIPQLFPQPPPETDPFLVSLRTVVLLH